MRIAHEGEETVCPEGTLGGRLIRDSEDQITGGDFSASESRFSAADQRSLCACCGRAVAIHEDLRWRVHLRRGWGR